MNLLKTDLLDLEIQKKGVNPDNLIYKYKNEGKTPKDFRNHRNPVELFKDLRDGNINPNEVLKNLINLKSGLGETKKGNKKSKSEDPTSVIQNVLFFFRLRENIIDFFKDCSFSI